MQQSGTKYAFFHQNKETKNTAVTRTLTYLKHTRLKLLKDVETVHVESGAVLTVVVGTGHDWPITHTFAAAED